MQLRHAMSPELAPTIMKNIHFYDTPQKLYSQFGV